MLRPARPEDVEAVHRIYMDASVIPYLGHDAMDLAAFREVFAGLLATNLQIAERDGAVAGFCRALRFDGRQSHVAQLGTLAVHPRWQGSGLAREMVETILAQLKADGVVRVELMAEADNARGLSFYRKLGFVEEGVQRRAYRRAGAEIDEIMMVRFLDV
jgi:putative acetyltransferase